jgi:hypothetical protein
MPMRGTLSDVARTVLGGALESGEISKPSVALFHASGFAVAMTYGAAPGSGLVRLTLAPARSRRLTTIAEVEPL